MRRIANHEVKLRAERFGIGTGRIYSITITATDGSNTSSRQCSRVTGKCTFTVHFSR